MSGISKDQLNDVKAIIKTKPADIDLYTWIGREVDLSIWEGKSKYINKETNNYELPMYIIPGCEYSYTCKLHTSSSYLYRGAGTSVGEILFCPEDLGDPDYIVIKDKYSGDEALCLILRAKSAPSLFHGRLRSITYAL
jgi:hypothetical protein